MSEKGSVWILVSVLLVTGSVIAQDHGGGGGGGGGCGDVFGDLIHIKRDPASGQPILAKRWIEYPQSVYGWGYCPIPVDSNGEEIPFTVLSCDPADPDAVVEVDYFGRLNGGRTKERNNRMHFNEVISSIKEAGFVKRHPTGRIMLGYECAKNPGGQTQCEEWNVVDSPMESLGLYSRMMKYGHLQTDPMEIDTWANGDPEAGVQYHPALGAADWGKFHDSVRDLLPGEGAAPDSCFGSGGFKAQCAEPEPLRSQDFEHAGAMLAGAADKGGIVTADLVQYLHRILKIPVATPHTSAPLDTLPALVRDCLAVEPPPPVGEEAPQEPEYPGPCEVYDATPDLPGYGFPADERFMDYGATDYTRSDKHDETVEVILPLDEGIWQLTDGVSLLDWLEFVNGPAKSYNAGAIGAYIDSANDALRSIEFVHNYAIPEDLGWDPGY